MSRAAANISRRQFMRRRAFGPRRGGLGEYGGYIAQNKAQAMLGGRFTGAPRIVTPNLFVARKSVPQGGWHSRVREVARGRPCGSRCR